MRRPYIFILPVLLGQCIDGSIPGPITRAPSQALSIRSMPIALDSRNPDQRKNGSLRFLGGWHLTSDTRGFGGFSALDVNGNVITMLSDAGTIVRFRLGRFGHVSDATMKRVPEGCGEVMRKSDNDTESLAHDPARATWWIGYEWKNAICRTNHDFSIGEATRSPASMAKWPRKNGAESMARLHDGRFIIIVEDAPDFGDVRPVVLFDRDPTDPAAVATISGYRPPKGYKPTEVAALPDGRILVLNRRFTLFSLFTAKLVLLPPIAIDARGTLSGRTIARFSSPIIADNYEGLAVTTENGRPIIWLNSDNNFMRWQRTLLLKFALD